MVVVARSWGGVGIEVAEIDLRGFVITDSAGGTAARLPRPTLAAYMLCTSIPEDSWGVFGHSCRHGPPPHKIKVLTFKGHNAAATYEKLRSQAE